MKLDSFTNVVKSIWPTADFLVSDAEGTSAGLATLWNPARLTGSTKHVSKINLFVHFKDLADDQQWNMLNIYAPNVKFIRDKLWNALANLINNGSHEA